MTRITRGSAINPTSRFEKLEWALEDDGVAPDASPTKTEYYRDFSRTIIARNDSPDVGFDASLNPYRGCEHGCAYCYARPTHEYLGLSAGLDFESKIFVKEEAAELLRHELSSPKWKPQVLAMSGVTDAYQPIERRLEITRRCLAVLAEFRNPVTIITKNALVTRDIDYLQELAKYNAVSVSLSVTTLDHELQKRLEPRASSPKQRMEAVRKLSDAGIRVGVNMGPLIPGLTDHELPEILRAASAAGAKRASYILLRLPHGVKELMDDWLTRNEPDKRDKVLNKLRGLCGGKLYDPSYFKRHRGEGFVADQIERIYRVYASRLRLDTELPPLDCTHFRRIQVIPPGDHQLELFG